MVTGPGIAKARELPLVFARKTLLVRASDARWRELFEGADAISEGGVRAEAPGRVWYGSTSLILPTRGKGDHALLVALASRDLNVRVRAMRAAQREASLRAPSRLGRISCEIRVTDDPRGVRIDVDVQAPLIERRASRRAVP
ncbi:MAG: hypothetical protein WBY94_28385 [Polyangiaceae bacterium]